MAAAAGSAARALAALAPVTLAACASTVAGTVGDGASSFNLALDVTLGPLPVGAPAAGARVRVTGRDGFTRDLTADAAGRVRANLPGDTTWSVTVARPDHGVVSLLDLRVPFAGAVRLLPLLRARPEGTTTAPFTVRVEGRDAQTTAVIVDGAAGTTSVVGDAASIAVARWPGAPEGFWLSAVSFGAGRRVLRGAYLDVPSRASPGAPTLRLALTPRRYAVRVETPVVGRFTQALLAATRPGNVLRFKATEIGETGVVVGAAAVTPNPAVGFLSLTVDQFDGPLAPELVTASLETREPDRLEGTVTTRPEFAGLAHAFAPVERLAAWPQGPGGALLEADATGWSRAHFSVRRPDGAVVWEAWSMSATRWEMIQTPSLPDGASIRAWANGGTLELRVCVARDQPELAAPPWAGVRHAVALWSLVSVCSRDVALR